MKLTELHVLPDERSGGWLVEDGAEETPLSRHHTAGEAEGAARRHAAGRTDCRIFLHDRYRRVRMIPHPPGGAALN